jgi:alanyl-tRNA synthetase
MTTASGKVRSSRELRESFLAFFAQHDHRVLPSSSLKPTDATTLFTSAGMQQFVPWFRGMVPPAHPRVATCQKCFRADDIEHVGQTPRHLTFFEMLGNFSFGDYFKRGAIELAWEYVTRVLGLPAARIWITVHPEDNEAPEIWRNTIGIPAARVVPDPTNWWGPVGPSGPCGPDTELHWDYGETTGCGRPECDPACGCARFTELWNLVFQTYHKTEEGELQPLPKPGIDTGMGLERVAAVLQDVPTVFDTDLFTPITAAVRQAFPRSPARAAEETTLATRVISEHVRALAFLLADGFTPSNEGAGYVLRRVLRRAYRFGRKLGTEEPFLHALVPSVVATMGDVYPELVAAQARIATWIEQEERQFAETLERSYAPLADAIERARSAGLKVLSGEEVFRLYDTYGLPSDLAAEIAAESGLRVDEQGFARALEGQRSRARARAQQDFASDLRSGYQDFVGKTRFTGYEATAGEGLVIGIAVGGTARGALSQGEEGEVFLDETPFYAEAGGQLGDRGGLEWPGGSAEVLGVTYPVEGAHAHHVRATRGELRVGQQTLLRVDAERRQAIARAHTATHLLHYALRETLGDHAVQSGSLVDADRLRFDFAHFAALTPEERDRIEARVVELALRDDALVTTEMPVEQARALGAMALFGEKYGERVRVVQIGDYSKELCGGTHLSRASAIGGFAIVSEGSIGTGLRRIEAVTGRLAHRLMAEQRALLSRAAAALDARPEELPARAEALQADLRRAQREVVRLQQRSAGALVEELGQQVTEVRGVRVLAARVQRLGAEALRQLADQMIARLGSGVVVIGCELDGRAHFVAEVSKDLVARGYHAGNLVREVAKLAGGGGGGRPDFAQAGGKSPERLEEALAKVKDLVAAQGK